MTLDPREIALALGGEASGRNALVPGPGHSPSDRSLSIMVDPDAPDGFRCHSFAGDDWRACRDHVRAMLRLEPQAQHAHSLQRSVRLVSSGYDEFGELLSPCVFGARRKIRRELSLRIILLPGIWRYRTMSLAMSFGFIRDFKLGDSFVESMVALYRDIESDEPCAIHRTFLDAKGCKLDRRMLGRAHGAAIKLDADDTVSLGLHIGEGIETCLAARSAGFKPVWSLGTASGFNRFPVLAGVETITFLAENDANGASERAIDKPAKLWLAAGREVLVVKPLTGKDLNDVWYEAA